MYKFVTISSCVLLVLHLGCLTFSLGHLLNRMISVRGDESTCTKYMHAYVVSEIMVVSS